MVSGNHTGGTANTCDSSLRDVEIIQKSGKTNPADAAATMTKTIARPTYRSGRTRARRLDERAPAGARMTASDIGASFIRHLSLVMHHGPRHPEGHERQREDD